ncbi:unnamed protein product [Mucor circinelloides]|uniref:Pre-rRNA processing protein n=1 Tax=Mucor circinelloides f. circinelloides (strain 1006PhL) TaxID=1220926 RepID=S2J826_MUCC1|nr:hypothetical protein HMPREF1544_07386 [Mucor circinelloides 1006PhL]
MPGSINEGQQAFAVQGAEQPQHLHQEYTTTTTTEQHQQLYADDGFEEYSEKPAAPVKKPFYKNKKYWIICSIITVILVVVVVLLILFVAFPKIAQSTLNHSEIEVNTAQITFQPPADSNLQPVAGADANSTFYMHMVTDLKKTGPFSADIQFDDNIEVIYNNTVLGTITLPDTHIGGGHGSIDTVTPFMITNVAAFSEFSRYMLAAEKFTWTLNGKAKITALTRTAEVTLNKDITLEGMNGFPQVKINSFQLPGDAVNGGILIELGTVLTSPSPIGVQLGHIEMNIGYDGIDLGLVHADNVTLQKGDNNILLSGIMKSQASDPVAQAKVSTLFSNYIAGKVSNTTAVGVSAAPDGKNPITWLSEGLKSVTLNVALAADKPLKIMNSVSMGYLDLNFNKDAPYAPSVKAPVVTAGFTIPFGFALNITEVTQNITLGLNKTTGFESFAVMNVPYVPSTSDQKSGKLQFAIDNTKIAGIPGKESVYNEYTYALTANNNYTFLIAGNATTKVNTTIGPLVLSGINFELPTELHGLQFLNSTATVINSLDVTGGQSDHLELGINVTMENPSDFSIATGDVTFAMLADSTNLGTVTLSNLTLNRGVNTVLAAAKFDPKSSDVGQNLLSTFVMGQDNGVQIGGTSESTPIASLIGALSQVSLSSNLPGLKVALIQGSALTVRPTTLSDGVVGVKVSIANPFTAGLTITKVVSAVTYNGMPVGNIDQDISSNPIVIPGKTTVQSGELDMKMNTEPAAVALLLRSLAVTSQLDTRPLDALLTLGGFNIEGQENVAADSSLFNGFNISTFVMDAMKSLKVDLSLASDLTIGQYVNTLSFSQAAVQTATDNTVTGLIPIVGQPIVQQIVDGSVLGFDSIIMSSPTEGSFKVQMKGSIAKTGPMAATISFPTPLTVAWGGKKLGVVTMPALEAKADVGASFDVSGDFTITDADAMSEFAAYMINNKDFIWDIYSTDVSVNALGFTFTKISMEKFVTLAGANGFKDAVKITTFDLPSNDPAGGITLTAQTTINNPSQVGFNFEGVGFESYYKGVDLGPLGSAGNAVFPPQGTANLAMKGRLVHQDSAEGIAAVTEVFENFLSANSSTLSVKGVSASGPNGVVQWLSAAFKTINIENVVLPGPPAKPNLITAVTMKDMQIDFTKNPFAPPTSSQNVEAQLKNPFGFPLGVKSLNMKVDANSEGHNVANLEVPESPATTSADGIVHTAFNGIPFKVYSGSEALFTKFVAGLTLAPVVPFGLKGVVNSVAQTAVGDLKLGNINFDVQTSLAGFASFGGTTEIVSLKVVGGTATYIAVDLVIALNNPSQITITAGDLNFDVIMDASGSKVGVVTLTNTVIKPGRNEMPASMKMTSTDLLSLSKMLTAYLTNQVTPLTVKGSANSTKIIPLQPGLAQVALKTNMKGIPASLVVENQMKMVGLTPHIWVKFYNPLDTIYTVAGVSADVYFTSNAGKYLKLGTLTGAIDPPVTVPSKGTAINENDLILKVELFNAIQFLQLKGDARKVDLFQNVTVVVGEAFHGGMYYEQKGVPVVDRDAAATAQALDLALKSMPGAANVTSSAVSSSAASTATTVIETATTTKAEQATPTTTTTTEQTATTPAATDNEESSTAPKSSDTASTSPQPEVVAANNFVLPF